MDASSDKSSSLIQGPEGGRASARGSVGGSEGQQEREAASKWRRRMSAQLKVDNRRGSVMRRSEAWHDAETVDLQASETASFRESHRESDEEEVSYCARMCEGLQGWWLAVLVAVGTACASCFVQLMTKLISAARMGWCRSQPFQSVSGCPEGDWQDWGDGSFGFILYVVPGVLLACAVSVLLNRVAPEAAASGLPEAKVLQNGFVLNRALGLRTLLCKIVGLPLIVGGGLALGNEEPMIHVGICLAHGLSSFFPQYQNEARRRELYSSAAAAAISASLGAPVGGVLFAYEALSSQFPQLTWVRAFFAACVAAIVVTIANSIGLHSSTSSYVVSYRVQVDTPELVAFAFLGIVGGLFGAAFNQINTHWARFRESSRYRNAMPNLLEVFILATLTLVTNFPMIKTRIGGWEVTHALFQSCKSPSHAALLSGLCTEDGQAVEYSMLALSLFAAAVLRLLQGSLTYGTRCIPGGLFAPCLFVGACLGRLVGNGMEAWDSAAPFINGEVRPGIYALMGAAAMLCGVTRASVSVLVIMLELTDSFLYIPTYMLVVLLANGVAAMFTEGIYESHIWIKGYPYLQEEIDVTYTERCCDIMVSQLTTVDLKKGPTIKDLNAMLDRKNYRGFPVVTGGHFIGYVRRQALVQCLDTMLERVPTDESFVTMNDLRPITDQTVMRMVPDAPLTQAHRVFKELEVQHVFLVGCKTTPDGHVENNMLHGVLSRKNFISYLASGRIGNPAGAHLFGSRGLTEHSRERMEQKEAEVKKSQLRASGALL